MMPMASTSSTASMPQHLTYICSNGSFVSVWGIVDTDTARFIRDMIEVYSPKLVEGHGTLRSISELIPGKIVLASFRGLFHRAEVIRYDGSQTRRVLVLLIDLGITTLVELTEIRLADGIFSSVPRVGVAEEYYLQGLICSKQWTHSETDSANACLSHCSEMSLTGVIGDRKIIQMSISMNNQSAIDLSAFLADGGLAELVSPEHFTRIVQLKSGGAVTSQAQVSYNVPPPKLPNNIPIPSTFAIPQQNQIRGPTSSTFTSQMPMPMPCLSQPYHRIRTPKPQNLTQAVGHVQSFIYPSLPVDSTHDVVVSHVIEGMNAFTVQLKKANNVDLPKLMAKINDINPIPFTEQLGPGAMCLGRFVGDKSLCRAVVSNVIAEGASLYFVDFGSTEIIPFNEIYKIPPEFLQEPTMAYRFALADLSTNYSLTTTEAHNIFTNLVLQEDLALKLKVVKSLVPTQQRCELFVVSNGRTINIKNKILDKVKLMKPVEYKRITFKKNQIADVFVTFAESPLRFYVQLELNASILEVIMNCVHEYCQTCENKEILYAEDVIENMAVCALYEEDNKWYRGIILDEPDGEGNVTVHYVDYGNQDSVHYSKLRIMNNEMMSQFPMQAVECRLDLDPSLMNNQSVNEMFIELADGQNFKMTVKNILPANVLLVDLNDQNNISLAEKLKEIFMVKQSPPPPVSPSAYSAPPRGNWREKTNQTGVEGDFSSFSRDEHQRSRADSNSNYSRSNHDDRGKSRNFDSRRRDADGVDTIDEADCKRNGDFWGREKGFRNERGDTEESWRQDRYPDKANDRFSGGRERNDGPRNTYRKRDENNDERSGNRRNSQDDNRGGGERRFDRGARPRDDDRPRRDDDRPRRDAGGGFRGRRDENDNDFGGRPPREGRRDDGDFRPPRRDRYNDGGSKTDDSWGGAQQNGQSNDSGWGGNHEKNDSNWGSNDNKDANDWGAKRDFGNRGGSFADSNRGGNRRDGGFRKRDDDFSSRSDNRGPRKWDNDFSSRTTVTLLDGFDKGAQIVDAEYQPGLEMNSVITWFVNPAHFYVIPSDNSDFRNLMEQIQAEYPKRKTIDTNELSPNDYIVARAKDNVIYRATVLRTSPRGVVVTFIDYGNTETVAKNQIWAISADHCAIPKQALCCSLHNVTSSDENGVWKATTEYDDFFGKDSFKTTLIENVEQENTMIWMVNLTDPDGKDVADLLIASNLAVRKTVFTSEELYNLDLLRNQTIPVFMGSVVSAQKFFVHMEPPKADHIGTFIQEYTQNPQVPSKIPEEKIIDGEFCLAPSTDESYYRALILSVNSEEKQAHVVFIDYGDESDVPFDTLRELPDYLKTYNPQAVECCLYDSESFTNNDDFVENVEEKDLLMKVIDVKDGKLFVKLFDVKGVSLPYPAESDETVPALSAASVLKRTENVLISSLTSGKVYLQRPSDQHTLNELNDKLFEKYDSEVDQEEATIEAGKFYVAKSGQFEAWYRCQLFESDPEKVFYMDYGNTEAIENLLAVRPLEEEFYSVPACCFGVSSDIEVAEESVETVMTAIQEIVFVATLKRNDNELFADLRSVDGKSIGDYVVELGCGTKRVSEQETIYDAFENWQPNEEKNVKVSGSFTPARFYLQLVEDAEKLNKLRDDLETSLKTVLPLIGKTSDLCAGKADDKKWYRCYQEDNIAIDYGFPLNATVFKKLPFEFANDKSKYCVECRLDVASVNKEWSTEALERFNELIKSDNELVAKLETVKESRIIDLISNGSSVTETLIAEGLANYQSYEVSVSHAVSLGEFYIQEESTKDQLFELLDKLKEAENWETVVPEVDQMVTAKFPEDEQWYRAVVTKVAEEEVNVLFVDYGNQSVCTEFRTLPDDLKAIPKFALRCAYTLPENADELNEKFVSFVEEHVDDVFSVYFLSRGEPSLVMLYFGDNLVDKLLTQQPAVEAEVAPQERGTFGIEFKTVYVVHINSPSSFYVQTETPLLNEVAELLETVEGEPAIDAMEIGTLYAAKYPEDEIWYRAKAIAPSEVLFIDYGNTSVVEEKRVLPEQIKKIPVLSKHCAFKTPPGLQEWPQVATERLSELICNGDATFVLEILEEGDPAFVQLTDNGASVVDELYTLCQAEETAISKESEQQKAAVLSYIDSLTEIWVQEQTPALDELCDELSNVEAFDALETANTGDLVAALFDEDDVWYRAKVLENVDDGFRVLFVDYGNESVVKSIKSLPEDLAGMPAFATCCRLIGLDEAEYPSEVLDKLKELSETVDSFVVVDQRVEDGVTYVELQYDQRSLADELNKYKVEVQNKREPCVVAEATSVSEFHLNDPVQVHIVQDAIQNGDKTDVEPIAGEVVCAVDEKDDTTYRCKVDSVDNKESCNVTRIDFGGSFVAKKWTLPPAEVIDIAPLALKCSLSMPQHLAEKKSEVNEKFLEIVQCKEATFTYKVDSCVDDVSNVCLYKNGVNVLDLLFPEEVELEKVERNDVVKELPQNNDNLTVEEKDENNSDVPSTSLEQNLPGEKPKIESISVVENVGVDVTTILLADSKSETIVPKTSDVGNEKIADTSKENLVKDEEGHTPDQPPNDDSIDLGEVSIGESVQENTSKVEQPSDQIDEIAPEKTTNEDDSFEVDYSPETSTAKLNDTESDDVTEEVIKSDVAVDVSAQPQREIKVQDGISNEDVKHDNGLESNILEVENLHTKDSFDQIPKTDVAFEVNSPEIDPFEVEVPETSLPESVPKNDAICEVEKSCEKEISDGSADDTTRVVEKSEEVEPEMQDVETEEISKIDDTCKVAKSDEAIESLVQDVEIAKISKSNHATSKVVESTEVNKPETKNSTAGVTSKIADSVTQPEVVSESFSSKPDAEKINESDDIPDEPESEPNVRVSADELDVKSKTIVQIETSPVSKSSIDDSKFEEIASLAGTESPDEAMLKSLNRESLANSEVSWESATGELNMTWACAYSPNPSKAESVYYMSIDEDGDNDDRASLNVSLGCCDNSVDEVRTESPNGEALSKYDETLAKAEEIESLEKTALEGEPKGADDDCEKYPYTVTCVENPGAFFVQKTSDARLLRKLEEHLEKMGENSDPVEGAEIGAMYAAKIDNSFHRVKLLELDPYLNYVVFCLDYGKETITNMLFDLPEQLKVIPPFAKRCGIPLSAHLSEWPQLVRDEFEAITLLNNPVFKLREIDPNLDTSDTLMVNLINDKVDVWKKMRDLCFDYDDDGTLSEDEPFLSPEDTFP